MMARILIVGIAWMLADTSLSHAQQASTTQQIPCWPRDVALSALSVRYDERPVLIGHTTRNRIVEVFSSPDGATFTVLISTARISCAVASGVDLIDASVSEPGDPS